MPMSTLTSPRPGRSSVTTSLERAVDSAIECLNRLERTDGVRDLAQRARQLKEQMQSWHASPPSTEVREALMRNAMSLQLAALALARQTSPFARPAPDGGGAQ
jgi:hypothetical protein